MLHNKNMPRIFIKKNVYSNHHYYHYHYYYDDDDDDNDT